MSVPGDVYIRSGRLEGERNWSLNCYYRSKCMKEAPNHQQESEQRIDRSYWRGDRARARSLEAYPGAVFDDSGPGAAVAG